MLDADTDLVKSWHAIETILIQTKQYKNTNIVLIPEGSVLIPKSQDESTVGVWLMPDNKADGMLEDFVSGLVPEGDVLMEKAEGVLQNLEKESIQRYKDIHRSKARIHTFLAWNDEPGLPMGLAITARVLNPDSRNAQLFVKWLERCFKEVI